MAEASQDSIKAYWSDIANSTRKEITSDPYFVVSEDCIMIARKCAYESYKEWCAKNNETVFKNRKFQSDTAYNSIVVEHRTKDTRFWKVQQTV
ncbi:unnamed protein product [Phytophthora lilii]|uniref:Unnamed protein product n=1 Tax=Phytophthora lilii TaxID=2077276 RepID=A0A9W6XFW8_9STRA|nr:unnamed protein product [Phytophthora lilii]